ncbi:Putative multidrug export ATP-binding/permease protein [Myxococcaceae bacterium]|nr:Putative multidrug export ATP-binding/permease protein [Myxococcaceae bacterium]
MNAISTSHPLWRCLGIYREMPKRFFLTAFLFTVVNLSLSGQQWLVGRAVHDAEQGKAVVRLADGSLDFTVAWHWLAILGGVALARGVVQYAAGILALIIGQELLSTLRERILAQVQRLDLGFHWQHGVGEMVTRTTRDADKVRDALVSFWRQVFDTALVIVASVGLLCWYDIQLGLVPLALTLLGIFIFVAQTDRLVALDRSVGAAYDRVNQDLSEGINGVRVIKAFAIEPDRVERFREQVDIFAEQARIALAYSASRIPLPQLVVSLGHVWVLLYGAELVAEGKINLGELVASLLVVTTLVFRVEGIGRVMQTFADARSSAARIWELLDAEPAFVSGQRPLPKAPLGLKLTDVSVATPGGGGDILHGLSLAIQPGEVVAIVGVTGSGKSTLASLFARLLDVDEGLLAVGSDKTGWRDVRRVDLGELRKRVHVAPQESFLFSDSLADNLRLAKPDASDAELREALALAAAEEVLDGLPHGLETRFGDRGVTLSGGQRQRVSLARALIGKPDILILDDATSALDAVTERTILNNIRRLKRADGHGTTLILIASKLSTILLADRVLMLGGGRIKAEGSHEALARTNAEYRDLLGLDHG